MATSKKAQNKAGIPARRRGQQMGDERSQPDKRTESEKETPATRGRRKDANKFFADDSSQMTGSRGEVPRDNTPSVPAAMPSEKEKMLGGEPYDPLDPQLSAERRRARLLCKALNDTRDDQQEERARLIRELIPASPGAWIEPPFYC